MDMREKQLSHQYFFEGKIMKARLDEVLLPNGRRARREVCEHVGGVGVLPVDRSGNIILVRQFRYPYDTELLEIPAGKLDHGAEDFTACGARELKEETGCTAGRIVPLGGAVPLARFPDRGGASARGARPDRGRDVLAAGRGRIRRGGAPAHRRGGGHDRAG